MSALKNFIIISAFYVVLGNFNVRNDVWFRNRQWLEGNFTEDRNTICTAEHSKGEITRGVCKPLDECLLLGGTNGGICGLQGTCCILEGSCFSSTDQKVAYFSNPYEFQPRCPFTVNFFSPEVCQIRLDFRRFSLTGPVVDLESVIRCSVDSFTIDNPFSNNGFQALCGLNHGQHIYIHVNSTQGNAITLNFDLLFRNMTDYPAIPNPDWSIGITQLECNPISFSDLSNSGPMHQEFKDKKNSNDIVNTDAALLAPTGCLQYHTERIGIYESFNYDNGWPFYHSNLNYVICFKRNLNTCGIRHTVLYFSMNENPGALPEVHCTETENPNPEGYELSLDYITIPGGIINNRHRDSYCGYIPASTHVTSFSPGPLFIAVRTDNIKANYIIEGGFRFIYEIISTSTECQ